MLLARSDKPEGKMYFGTTVHHSSVWGEHIHHNCSICKTIEINGDTHVIEWQNGHGYLGNDYGCPSNAFSIYIDNCTGKYAPVFWDIWSLREDEIDQEVVDQINEETLPEGVSITLDECVALYEFLNDEEPSLEVDGACFTNDIDDYDVYDYDGNNEPMRYKLKTLRETDWENGL